MARLINQFRRYFSRFPSLQRGASGHGMRESWRHRKWARTVSGWAGFEQVGDGEIGSFEALRASLEKAAHDNPELIAQARQDFENGSYAFLGQAPAPLFTSEGRVDSAFWFTDPASGTKWPGEEMAAFSIPVQIAGSDRFDVKFVWEANRLQFLQPVAAALAAEQDSKLQSRVLSVIRNWASSNPPGRGINWISGTELSLRIVSLAIIVAGIGPDRLDKADRRLVRRMAAAHGRQLAAFLPRDFSAGKQPVAEALGLLVASQIAPDLADARGWARTARSIIETEALEQILPDGVGCDQSPSYQAFTMEIIATALLLSRGTSIAFSSAVERRLAAAARFIRALADRNGTVPAIGDDGESRVICNTGRRETRYPASVAAAVGGLLGKPELAALPRDWGLRDAIFSVAEHGSAVDRPLPDVQVFPCGGYSIVRDDINARRVHLVFDHGPQGGDELTSHGHADALSVWMSVDGRPVFIDAGTYLFHAGGNERVRLRESGMHNTLAVADVSLAQAKGAFGWKTRADAEFLMFRSGPDWAVAGRHDGYARTFRTTHIRQIERTEGGFSISDTLDGAKEVLPVSIRFLCAPGLEITRRNNTVSIAGEAGDLIDLNAPEGFSAAIVNVEFSPGFGERSTTRQIIFTGALAPGAVAVTGVRSVAAKAAARVVKHGKVVEAAWAKGTAKGLSDGRKSTLTGSQS